MRYRYRSTHLGDRRFPASRRHRAWVYKFEKFGHRVGLFVSSPQRGVGWLIKINAERDGQ
jgi:hypothetical protein